MTIQELLSDESKWTKGTAARNSSGSPVHPTNKNAVKFCLIGAAVRCGVDKELIQPAVKELGFCRISIFNDHPDTTFADIRRVIEEANV
jgi:hypothetical protein